VPYVPTRDFEKLVPTCLVLVIKTRTRIRS